MGIEILFYILAALIETALLWFFLGHFSRPKKIRREIWLLVQLLYFVYQFMTYLFDLPLFSSAPITYILAFIMTYLLYEDNSYFHTMTIHLFIVLNYACRLLAYSLIRCFHLVIEEEIAGALPVLSYGTEVLAYALVAIFTLGMRKLQRLLKKGPGSFYQILMLILPGVYLFSLAFLVVMTIKPVDSIIINFFFFSICLLSLSFVLFYHLDQLAAINRSAHYMQLTQEILEVNKIHYAEIMRSQEELLRIKHDFLKHLNTLHNYCATKHTKEAENYITQLLKHPLYQRQTVRTSNTIIDSILNQSLSKLSEEGITLNYQVMIPPVLPFEDVDICVILSNLLSNATEATNKLSEEERKNAKIDLSILQKKSFLFIEIKNNFIGPILVKDGLFLSSKRDMQDPGIGINNIKATVDKYHGVMKIIHTDSTFQVKIMMPIDNII